jgi:hypothetical protein
MGLYDLLQFSVCLFSILAAGFWLQSGAHKLAMPAENQNWDRARSVPQALASQSRWNAAGAMCAGIAAFSESVVAVLPYAAG